VVLRTMPYKSYQRAANEMGLSYITREPASEDLSPTNVSSICRQRILRIRKRIRITPGLVCKGAIAY